VSGSEQRRHPRFTVEEVRGQLVRASKVEILNLSLGGAAIRADRRLNIGAEYTLKLEMGDRFLSLTGVVVWSVLSGLRGAKGEETPQYSAGLKFAAALTDKMQDLAEFIDENRIVEEHRLVGLRFQVDAPGKALLDSLESYHVRRISLSGMLIEAERSLEAERVYAMYFHTPHGERVAFAGRVASCREETTGGTRRFSIGVAFLDMAGRDRERLAAYVSSLAPRAPAP
jgi:hypothetical protein